MVDNRYSGVGYEPPIECAKCADLRRQLEVLVAANADLNRQVVAAWATQEQLTEARAELERIAGIKLETRKVIIARAALRQK